MTATQLTGFLRTPDTTSTPLKTIVVATDFSESSDEALVWAKELASAHGAEVVLVHGIEAELAAMAEEGLLPHHVHNKLERLRQVHQLNGRTTFAPGKSWEVIARAAEDSNADLIVIGAHGQSKISERMLGTVADRLIKSTSIPVLTYRGIQNRRSLGIRTILAATDFSEEAALAVSAAVRILRGTGQPARLVLFHSVALRINNPALSETKSMPKYWDEAEATAATQLESLAASLRSSQLKVDVKTYRGEPGAGILHEAVSINADLIAIGTAGRTGLNRFFLGSIAEQVLHNAVCPVLTARRPDEDEPVRLSVE